MHSEFFLLLSSTSTWMDYLCHPQRKDLYHTDQKACLSHHDAYHLPNKRNVTKLCATWLNLSRRVWKILEYFSHLILINKVPTWWYARLKAVTGIDGSKFLLGGVFLYLGVRKVTSNFYLEVSSLNLGVRNVTSNVYLEASLSILTRLRPRLSGITCSDNNFELYKLWS